MNENGTIIKLHYFAMSFYSQRALFTLLEKGIKFEHVLVNIHAGEQYRPEYLHLNPYGAVPTLQDGVKVIPDSSAIMEYLEDNFSNGEYPRLMPLDKSSEMYRKVSAFTDELLKLNMFTFTFGTFHSEDLRKNANIPQFVIRRMVKETRPEEDKAQLIVSLEKAMEENPEAREVLEKKRDKMRGLLASVVDPDQHRAAMKDVEAFLQRAEDELAGHTGAQSGWWLCGPTFSLADIDLCVLLNRVCLLGLHERLVACRPNVAAYLKRARQRPAFQKTTALPIKLRMFMVGERILSLVPWVLGIGALAAAAYGIYLGRRQA